MFTKYIVKSVLEQCYNEGLIHRKYRAVGTMLVPCYKRICDIMGHFIIKLLCISGQTDHCSQV